MAACCRHFFQLNLEMKMHIITWNSQGAKLDGYRWRLKTKPDVMVVQECGNLPRELGYQQADQLRLGVPKILVKSRGMFVVGVDGRKWMMTEPCCPI